MKRRTHYPPESGPGKRPILFGLGAAALALLIVVAVLSSRPSESPATFTPGTAGRLVASKSTVDLGQVPFDRMIEAQYELVNSGARPVRVLDTPAVKTLAGC